MGPPIKSEGDGGGAHKGSARRILHNTVIPRLVRDKPGDDGERREAALKA
jgi:hypothetical protein